ncbi:glycoside hydrolase superfamily [Aspergillus recurvatus]
MKINLAARIVASFPSLTWLGNWKQAQPGAPPPVPVNLTILREGGNRSSPLLHGIMFEVPGTHSSPLGSVSIGVALTYRAMQEMDHSGDGGLHGNLLINNGFQGADPGLTGYKAIGSVQITRSPSNPVSAAIKSSLSVSVRADAKGLVGFANTGYNGITVLNQTYWTSFYMKGEYSGTVVVRLTGTDSGIVHGSRNLTVGSSGGKWTQYEASFNASWSDVAENEWQLLFDADIARGHPLHFGLVQLFPPTANGLRDDIAQPIADLKPKFLRFPGGNNIEGLDINSRWKWNETVGPLVDRPGRQSDWHYPNTDALGLDEYLWWCEDMHMVPLLSVWDGKSYGGIVSGEDLQPYLEDIRNELEYLLGPSTTPFGALRARNGHPAPWPIQYIEIGNEDDYTGGCDTYPDRLVQFYDTIHTLYPNVTLIANNMDEACLPENPLPGLWHDYHYYRSADVLVAMFNYWDNHDRRHKVLVGEYGCRNDSSPEGVYWSSMQGSCAEAVHMIGLERNSDVVMMAAYAPLLQHFGYTQWSMGYQPTLLGFDSRPGSLTLSTSYYVNRMFSTNQGSTVHRVRSTASFGPLYWVATSNETSYQVKLANYGAANQTVNIRVPGVGRGVLEMIFGPKDASNLPGKVKIVPVLSDIRAGREGYTVHIPPWGVAVLVVIFK